MKIVNIIKNYLPHKECDELNTWVINAIHTKKIGLGATISTKESNPADNLDAQCGGCGTTATLRYTSRMYADRYVYPQLVRDTHKQIEVEFNLQKWHEPVHFHGRDGVVVSATYPGGDVFRHKDPKDRQEPKEVLRCNILTAEATGGGLIWVGDQSYILQKGDMMQYLVSRHYHHVEPIVGSAECLRIMWMFGWYVDGDIWEASIQENI